MDRPILIILAGPNGAGKSTFYEAYLSHLDLPFLNADVLAAITGLGAYEAADQIAFLRDHMIRNRQSLILETVLSDPIGAKVDFLSSVVDEGYDVKLIFIGIADVELSRQRVKDRSRAGGHDVPEDKLVARYPRTLKNLKRCIFKLPQVVLYDNSHYMNPYCFIARFHNAKVSESCDDAIPEWAKSFLTD